MVRKRKGLTVGERMGVLVWGLLSRVCFLCLCLQFTGFARPLLDLLLVDFSVVGATGLCFVDVLFLSCEILESSCSLYLSHAFPLLMKVSHWN